MLQDFDRLQQNLICAPGDMLYNVIGDAGAVTTYDEDLFILRR